MGAYKPSTYKMPPQASDWGAWLREDLELFLDAVGMAADATTEQQRSEITAWARDRFVDAIENLRGFEHCFEIVEREAREQGHLEGFEKALERIQELRVEQKAASNVIDIATRAPAE
jgi:flagellar biosynthesis/type III secretory pathway protein FliH